MKDSCSGVPAFFRLRLPTSGVGRNVGSVMRIRTDLTWQKIDCNLLGANQDVYIRARVFQGWLRRLTADDG